MRLHYITAGESHGGGMTATVIGMPYGVPVDRDRINRELKRRQGGYGRSSRMTIEHDEVSFLSGIHRGKTIGGPITMFIKNAIQNIDQLKPIHRPRPGHADLAGMTKLGIDDARAIAERASARETTARVAAGALATSFLSRFGIDVCGYVVAVGGISSPPAAADGKGLRKRRDSSAFYLADPTLDNRVKRLIDRAKGRGDTLGGVVETAVFNIPPGLGSHALWTEKLDSAIARALISIQTIKGVEFGLGFASAKLPGSKTHDEILLRRGRIARRSNNAGGIEGGISNGEPIVVRAAAKPIPTLRSPLRTVDMETMKPVDARYERSDVCAVPAVSVIAEAVVGFEIARAFLDKFGGDTFAETERRYRQGLRDIEIFLARKS